MRSPGSLARSKTKPPMRGNLTTASTTTSLSQQTNLTAFMSTPRLRLKPVIKIAKLGVSRLVTEAAYYSHWKRLGYTIEEPKQKPKKAKPIKEEAPQPKKEKKDTPKKAG